MKNNLLSTIFTTCFIVFFLQNLMWAQNSIHIKAQSFSSTKSQVSFSDLKEVDLFQIDGRAIYEFAQENSGHPFVLHLEIDGKRDWEIELQASKVHGDHYKVIMSTGEEIIAETNITYKGFLKDRPEIEARVTISNHSIQGVIFDKQMHGFETINKDEKRSSSDLMAIYEVAENTSQSSSCGFDTPQYNNNSEQQTPILEPLDLIQNPPPSAPAYSKSLNSTYCPKLGVTLDWQGLNHAGSVAQFNADLQSTLNIINSYHDNQFGVEFELTPVHVIASAPNPWIDNSCCDGEENMYNYKDWAKNNFPYPFTCTLLFTGQNFNGISWGMIDRMCTSTAAGQIAYADYSAAHRGNISTHEIGHIWGCPHGATSSQYIMSPSIWPNTLQWTSSSTSIINNKISSLGSCLPNCGGGTDCSPFVDNDNDGYCSDVDCFDNDPTSYPGAAEICDGIDNNCNGQIDEVNCSGSYCTPIHTGSENELITNVSLNTINNTTGGWSTNITGYSDYTNISTQVEIGTNYTISVTPNFSWTDSRLGIWADWNQDYVFQSNEEIASLNGVGPWVASFTPPSGAVMGTTRLRIRLQYGSSYTPDPCEGTWHYSGETEDYSLVVQNCPSVDNHDFESNWGIWNDGGSDCRRNLKDSLFANSGVRCVRLRDNTSTSVMTTDPLDLSTLDEITVNFFYRAESFENTEDFWLQLSTDGGATFNTVEDWIRTVDFQNGESHNPSVTINGPFTSTTQLRFRCDASGNGDRVYIDDVQIQGCGSDGNNLLITSGSNNQLSPMAIVDEHKHSKEAIDSQVDKVDKFHIFPNPASTELMIEYKALEEVVSSVNLYSLTGQKVLSIPVEIREGPNTFRLNVGQLPKGIYLVDIEGEQSKKLVVLK